MKEATSLSPELQELYKADNKSSMYPRGRASIATSGQATRQRSLSSGRRKTSKDLVAEIYDRMGISRTNPMSSADKFKERYRAAAELSRGRSKETEEELKRRSRSLSRGRNKQISTKKWPPEKPEEEVEGRQESEQVEEVSEKKEGEKRELDEVSVKSVKDRRSMFDKKPSSRSPVRGRVDPSYKIKLAANRSKPSKVDIFGDGKQVMSVPSDEEVTKQQQEEPDYFQGRFRKPVLEKSSRKISDNASVGTHKSAKSAKSFATNRSSKSKKMEDFFLKAIGQQPQEIIVPPPKNIETPTGKGIEHNDEIVDDDDASAMSSVSGAEFSYKLRQSAMTKKIPILDKAESKDSMDLRVEELVAKRMSEIEHKLEKDMQYMFKKLELKMETAIAQLEKKMLAK